MNICLLFHSLIFLSKIMPKDVTTLHFNIFFIFLFSNLIELHRFLFLFVVIILQSQLPRRYYFVYVTSSSSSSVSNTPTNYLTKIIFQLNQFYKNRISPWYLVVIISIFYYLAVIIYLTVFRKKIAYYPVFTIDPSPFLCSIFMQCPQGR